MKIRRRTEGDVLVLTPVGHFGSGVTALFTEEISSAIEAGRVRVLLDLGSLEFIDSLGIEALIRSAKRLALHGGGLAAFRPAPFVRKVFSRLGLTHALPVFEDEAEGIAHLGS